jgi:hypothetical protein
VRAARRGVELRPAARERADEHRSGGGVIAVSAGGHRVESARLARVELVHAARIARGHHLRDRQERDQRADTRECHGAAPAAAEQIVEDRPAWRFLVPTTLIDAQSGAIYPRPRDGFA